MLLQATNISKSYASSLRPLTVFFDALLKRKSRGVGGKKVLNGISLEVRSGETVGIIGRNGAGKSTLLGILGNVIEPTEGHVSRYGRIATLLGLTAGFNMSFTGRENAYLFCSIQGISKKDTDKRIADIIEFADLGEYFDQPLRTYSSGMQSRLAFACAVHVDADLIIIDETLAVGDASFRMKCYDRIRAMRDTGQTFLLVTHNQNLLANFCTRAVVIEGGKKLHDGAVFEAIEVYKGVRAEQEPAKAKVGKVTMKPELLKDFLLEYQKDSNQFLFKARFLAKNSAECVAFNFGIRNSSGITVCAIDGAETGPLLYNVTEGEEYSLQFSFNNHLLGGKYFLSYIVNQVAGDAIVPLEMAQNFFNFDVSSVSGQTGIVDLGLTLSSSRI
ncbi:ABC transporter ATP-binding protein [Pseudomonas frederiksbergensis]|uniref:ABC transporter ATP-binding protein n=1 Tax=Pseudomonas frederiksbergensis TaxID=104087 RepID=UPI002DB9273B|nr:ABC transporter ATP-binding protein [Pseudomonas frederiksbergensis]WRV66831.1 ABC transporter ATP-binding protein [Pseudomonas frederiksbergensis]